YFRKNQALPHSEPPGNRAALFLQLFSDVCAPDAEGRLEAACKPHQYGRQKCKCKDSRIDFRFRQPWDAGRTEAFDQLQSPVTRPTAERSAREREEKALRHQLARHSGSG